MYILHGLAWSAASCQRPKRISLAEVSGRRVPGASRSQTRYCSLEPKVLCDCVLVSVGFLFFSSVVCVGCGIYKVICCCIECEVLVGEFAEPGSGQCVLDEVNPLQPICVDCCLGVVALHK